MINKIRIINKIGLLIVIIGFFMPISCNQNGFQLAEYMIKLEGNSFICGILLYVLFVSALLGVIIGCAILMKKNVNIAYDWLLVLICIVSGFFVYFKMIDSVDMLQSGAYTIITGWVISFFTLFGSKEAVINSDIENKIQGDNTND